LSIYTGRRALGAPLEGSIMSSNLLALSQPQLSITMENPIGPKSKPLFGSSTDGAAIIRIAAT
jgi:hypothetical protein